MWVFDSFFLSRFFRLAADKLEKNRNVLCELDGEVGDGDHGTSMADGFAAVAKMHRTNEDFQRWPAQVLEESASCFINEVGATVGPLYASAFLQVAQLFGRNQSLPHTSIGDILRAFATGIEQRGKARLRDKTMLDAWIPAATAAQRQIQSDSDIITAAHEAVKEARRGTESTTSMIASKGRAASLKERTLGHFDPGAMSATIIIEAFAQTITELEDQPE